MLNDYGLPDPDPDTGLYNPFPTPISSEEIARRFEEQRQIARQRALDRPLLEQSEAIARQQDLDAISKKVIQSMQTPAVSPTQPTQPKPADDTILGNAAAAIKNEAANTLRTAEAGKAFAMGDTGKLAELATQKEDITAPQQRFRTARGESDIWSFLPNLAKAAVKEPQGAFDAALQLATGFAPYIGADIVGGAAGTLVGGPLGSAVGSTAAVSLTAGELTAGQMSLQLIRKYATADGVNVSNATDVKNWLEKGGMERVFGPTSAAAATDTTLAAISLGFAGYFSRLARGSLAASLGPEGPLQPAVVNALRSTATKQSAASVASAGLGFPAADALAQLAAGESPDEGELFGSALMMTLLSLGHARTPFKELNREIKASTPPRTETQGSEGKTTTTEAKGDLTDEQVKAIADEAVPVKKATGPEEKVTQEQIDAVQDFSLPEAATTMHVVQDAMKEAVGEVLSDANAEVEGRKAQRAAEVGKPDDTAVSPLEPPAATDATPLVESAVESATGTGRAETNTPTQPPELAGDGQVHERGSGEVETGPAGRTDIGVNEEGIHPAATFEPRSDQPTRSAGRNRKEPTAKSKLLGVDESGAERSGTGEGVLLAGREATEEANRRAQADVNEALKREQEGGVYGEDLNVVHRRGLNSVLRDTDHLTLPSAVTRDLEQGTATADRALEAIARESGSPLTRALATAMRKALHGQEVPIEVRRGMTTKYLDSEYPVSGRFTYADGKGRILVDPDHIPTTALLMHELTHAATHYAINKLPTPESYTAVANLNEMLTRAQVHAKGTEHEFHYGLNGPGNAAIHEFVAEAFSNRNFQRFLSTIPWDANPLRRQSVWQAFKEAVARVLSSLFPGRERSVLYNTILNSFELFDAPKREPLKFEDLNSITRKQDEANTEVAKSLNKQGPGHILGLKDSAVTHRAWDNGDGTYRLYDVTPDEPMGAKESKQVLNEDQVRTAIEATGSDVQDRTVRGFEQEPGNTRDMIARWKDGVLVYTAVKDEQGQWHSQISEDLTSRTVPRTRDSYATRREAENAADAVSEHATKQASEAAEEGKGLKNLLAAKGASNIVVPGTPGWVQNMLTSRDSPVRYIAGATDALLKRLGLQAPPGMRLNTTWMLKNSDVGRMTMDMLKNQAEPLLAKTRALMKQYGDYFKGKEGYERLNSAISDLVAAERLPKKRDQFSDETTWVDPNNYSLGHTKYYDDNVRKEAAANQRLAQLPAGLRDALYNHMREWKRFSDGTIDQKYRDGLLTKTQAERMKAAYDIYAPLREEGKATKTTATGTSAAGANVLERMVEARADAILRGVDNNAVRTLRNMNRTFDYRNEDGSKIFKIDPIDREHLKFDPESGEVTVIDVMEPKNSVVYYEGGVPMRMEVNNPTLLKSLSRFKGEERDTAIKKLYGAMGLYTRMFGVLHTSASPPFAIRNFIRDYFTNLSQLDPRIKYGDFHAAMLDPAVWSAAMRLGFREAFSLTGKDALQGTSEGAKLAREVHDNGALIEHGSRYGVDQITNEHATTLRPTLKSKAAEYVAPTDGKITNFLTGLTHSLEAVNRIAVFKAAMKAGVDPRDAAVMAKNSTTNFEQRGQWGPNISPFYAFSNAKLQGARTLAENLGFTHIQGPTRGGVVQGFKGLLPGAAKAESANPRTIRAAQLAIALGLGAAYANYKTSKKDPDGRTEYGKRSEYQLDEYLHIPGLDIDLPIPQEIGAFYNTGSSLGDQLWGDRAGAASTPAVRFATAMIQNFWPGGTSMHDPIGTGGVGGDYAFRLAMPTPFLSLYDNTVNMDSFGRKINPQRDNKTIPPEMQGAATASPLARTVAQGMAKAGIMDASPKEIDHFLLGMFQQQKGIKNAVTDGNVGALLDETFKSFHQKVFPGTNKLDYEAISEQLKTDVARAAGNPLKNKQYTGLTKEFAQTDNKLKTLAGQWNKATTKEAKERIDKQEDELRMRTLRKYYEANNILRP